MELFKLNETSFVNGAQIRAINFIKKNPTEWIIRIGCSNGVVEEMLGYISIEHAKKAAEEIFGALDPKIVEEKLKKGVKK